MSHFARLRSITGAAFGLALALLIGAGCGKPPKRLSTFSGPKKLNEDLRDMVCGLWIKR